MFTDPLFIAALSFAAGGALMQLVRQWKEGERVPLDIKHLEAEEATTTIEVAGGKFEVEYRPHAATRVFQTSFAALQREQGEAMQDGISDEDLKAINDEITEMLQKLIVSWDLEYDGEPIPVSSEGLDRLAMPVQQALFQGVLTAASGGSEEEKKASRRPSRRSSS